MARLSIAVLGPFVAKLHDQPIQGFRSGKVRALLAFLSVEAARVWPRSTLADLLWPEYPETAAQSNFRNALSNLRAVLGDRPAEHPCLRVTRATVQFNRSSDYWLDAEAFSGLLAEDALVAEALPAEAPLARLQRALDLCRGEFLEGLSVDSAPFEEWVLVTRERFQQQRLRTVRRLALAHAQRGEDNAAAESTRRWLALDPWEEGAHRHLMRLLARQGQRGAALRQYETCREALVADLGLEPAPETVQLRDDIRAGRSLTPFAPPALFDVPARPATRAAALPDFLHHDRENIPDRPRFVAREKELGRLTAALAQSAAGHGSIMFVSGEPGSGKSALLEAFALRALRHDANVLVARGQCTAFSGQGDPYCPFMNITRMLAGDLESAVATGQITPAVAQRLWQHLPLTLDCLLTYGETLVNHFIPERLLQDAAQAHGGLQIAEQMGRLQAKRRMAGSAQLDLHQAALFEQFTGMVLALAQRRPLVLILDDMQWIDRGSVNLLFHLGKRVSGSRVLIVGAYRSEEIHRSPQEAQSRPLLDVIYEFQRLFGDILIDLHQSPGELFIGALLDSEPNDLGPEFRRQLLHRTSGNPLFAIELLSGMRRRGEIYRGRKGQWVARQSLQWESMPARVEAVMAMRINQLSPACQELLAAASIEGVQFTLEIVAEALGMDVLQAGDLLGREAGNQHGLVSRPVLFRINGLRLARFRFRHSLLQAFLYNRLDALEKARLHGLIGHALEGIYGVHFDAHPEIAHTLARHFEVAQMAKKAVQYYTLAGKHALHVAAGVEASTHFRAALRLLQTLPETEERDRQELFLQLGLGPALTAIKGWASPELPATYERALALCRRIDDNAQLIPALWLLARYHLERAQHTVVESLLERLERVAGKAGDPVLQTLAHMEIASFYKGDFTVARKKLERAAAQPDLHQQRFLAQEYGIAPAVVGQAYLAQCLWIMGFGAHADRLAQEARARAGQIQHPLISCYTVARSCWLETLKGEADAVRAHAQALQQLAGAHSFRKFGLIATFFNDWADMQQAASTSRIEQMWQTVEAYRATNTVLNHPAYLGLFAQACGQAGLRDRGLNAVDASLRLAEQTGEMWFQSEARRIKGELLLSTTGRAAEMPALCGAAEASFEQARRLAERQAARAFQLRAVISLCRLRLGQGRAAEDLTLLESLIAQPGARWAPADLQQAQTLLAQR